MLNIGVLVSGGGTNLQAILDQIADGRLGDVRVSTVISSRSDAYALTRAAQAGIPNACIRKKDYGNQTDFEAAMVRFLRDNQVDLVVLAGFLSILGEEFIRAFENRIINIHPALIPAFCGPGYYGLRVHEAALRRGVKVTGATVHFVTAEVDGGPILLQKAVDVLNGDTPETLQRRVMEQAEWVVLPEAIRMLAQRKVERGEFP